MNTRAQYTRKHQVRFSIGQRIEALISDAYGGEPLWTTAYVVDIRPGSMCPDGLERFEIEATAPECAHFHWVPAPQMRAAR